MEADIRDVQASCQQLGNGVQGGPLSQHCQPRSAACCGSLADVEQQRQHFAERNMSASARIKQAKAQLAAEEDALRCELSM
jgi:hypothetical protein